MKRFWFICLFLIFSFGYLRSAPVTVYTGSADLDNFGDGAFPMYQRHYWQANVPIGLPLKFFVTWNNYNLSPNGVVWSTTEDDGVTWTSPTQLHGSSQADRVSITSDGGGNPDTLFLVYSPSRSNAIANDSIWVFIMQFDGTKVDSVALGLQGYRASIEWQKGDTFWVAFTKNSTGTAQAVTYYSTDRCRTWTFEDSISLGTANVAVGCNKLLKTEGNRIVHVFTQNVSTAGSPAIRWRPFGSPASFNWSAVNNVDTADARFGSACIVGDNQKDVAMVYQVASNGFICMRKWYDSDSTVHNARDTVFMNNSGGVGDNICDCYGWKGDSIMVFTEDEPMLIGSTVPAPNNYHRMPFYRISPWQDSVLWANSYEGKAFGQVWKDSGGTWIDYTTKSADNVQSDMRFFGNSDDTFYYALNEPFWRIQWYFNTRGSDDANTITFQYWDSTAGAWATMTVAESHPVANHDLFTTTSSSAYQYVIFDSLPNNWGYTSINNSADLYYIRIYSSGAFTTVPIGAFATPSSYQTMGGFVNLPSGSVQTRVDFLWVRGGRATNQKSRIMFNTKGQVGGGGLQGGTGITMVYNGGTPLTSQAMEPPWRDKAVRTSDGTLVVAWQSGTSSIPGLVYSRSTDNGATWLPPTQLETNTSRRPSLIAVGDTCYVICSNVSTVTEAPITIYKFVPGGAKSTIPTPDTSGTDDVQGIMADICYESGIEASKTLWVSLRRDKDHSGSSNDTTCIWIFYSTDSGQTWTLSKIIRIATAITSAAVGEHQLLHTSGNKLVMPLSGRVGTGVQGSIRLLYRNDSDSKSAWQPIQDIYETSNGRWSGAWTLPGDSNVIIHTLSSNSDTSKVYIWKNGIASKGDSAVVFHTGNWTAGKNITMANVGYAGDTVFAVAAGQFTGLTDGALDHSRSFLFKKSVNGTTWIDSTNYVEPEGIAFDKVWRDSATTWTDYTTNANNNTDNDVDWWGATDDYLYFGSNNKYNYINFVEGTPGANGAQTMTWQYWNGSTWTALGVAVSEPNNAGFLTAESSSVYVSHQIWFDAPGSWVKTQVNTDASPGYYYVRLSSSTPFVTTKPEMATVSAEINNSNPCILRSNPTTFFGTAYQRGSKTGYNNADIMFAKYTLTPPGAAGKRNRTALIRLLGD